MNILELSLALVALNLSALGFAISAFMVEQVNYLEIVLSVVGIISSVLAMALKFFDLDASLLRQAQREERALRQVVLQGVIMHVARTTHRTRLGQALGSFATRLAFIRRVRYQRRRVASSLFTHWLKKHMVKYPAVMVDLAKTVEYKARIKREISPQLPPRACSHSCRLPPSLARSLEWLQGAHEGGEDPSDH